MQKLGFFAYPSGHPIIADAVDGAMERSRESPLALKAWQAMRVIGFKIDDRVRADVAAAAVLIADITYPNMNVLYEMGYAIAIGKPVPEITAIVQTINDSLGLSVADTIELLLWYGFLGFMSEAQVPLFIYDVEYDYRRLEAERDRLEGDVFYVVNSAFLKGLSKAG